MSIDSRKKRIFTGVIAIALVFVLLVIDLVKIQLINGDEYKASADSLSVSVSTVKAARGEIIDCNGNPLVTNRQGNSVVFKDTDFPSSKNQEERNELIFNLINLFEKYDVEWIDRLPILYKNGEFIIDENKETEFKYMVSENMLEMEKGENASADECMDALITRYKLENFSRENARKIASVCFGMKYLSFSVSSPYTFAEDVPTEIVSVIMEQSNKFPGVESETVSYREYTDTTSYSHILGVVGSISAEEYEAENQKLQEELSDETLTGSEITLLKNNAYSLNDTYGKSGIEGSMEKYLRGTNGIKSTTTASDGSIIEDYISKPKQGNTVVTTIDGELQKIAAKALKEMLIDNKNSSYFGTAGAMVVMNCKTGAILASVSLPTYDITTYFKNYGKLVKDAQSPLWNRALQSTYAPGSTMKPAIAIAFLEEEAITQNSTCYCGGTYTIEDQTFKCLSTHGYLNVETALEKSCNIFFFEMGKKLGIDKMNKYCNLLGLGQKTGVELPEAEGVLASIANREAAGGVWNPGDTVQAAIGQSDNLFTPLQLANYVATIANGGTRYKPYIIKSVLSADMSEVIYETEPEVLNTINVSEKTLKIVKQGMRNVVTNSSPSIYYSKCIVDVAGKTGTSQLNRTTQSGVSMKCNNGFFISFAPYDDPEIAIAIVAENALTGGKTSQAAVPVYNYYFSQKTQYQQTESQNTLIP
ncbi:MAG: hypothetical protein KIG53_00005 [Oscillospiraceae bacterium]|nr:hypothetical protein [Oscillospiraceae bacterium]